MRILILSPLFPPDTGAPADYVKELATRLSQDHTVTVLLYGYLPEAVADITFVAVDKRKHLPLRIISFTRSLLKLHEQADCILINNGPSVELPVLLSGVLSKKSCLYLESDPLARIQKKNTLSYRLSQSLRKKVTRVLVLPDPSVYKKADMLPFTPFDEQTEEARQIWWSQHVTELLS